MNYCKDFLTDEEYLTHMIPHHQVAIDMSYELMKHTTDPTLLSFARDIIWNQNAEILHMKQILNSKIPQMELGDNQVRNKIETKNYAIELYYNEKHYKRNVDCHRKFFEHIHNETPMTEDAYLEHMIDHHQIAVDMSVRLLIHTNNALLQSLCQNIIIQQKNEIFIMLKLMNRLRLCSELL